MSTKDVTVSQHDNIHHAFTFDYEFLIVLHANGLEREKDGDNCITTSRS